MNYSTYVIINHWKSLCFKVSLTSAPLAFLIISADPDDCSGSGKPRRTRWRLYQCKYTVLSVTQYVLLKRQYQTVEKEVCNFKSAQ